MWCGNTLVTCGGTWWFVMGGVEMGPRVTQRRKGARERSPNIVR